MTKPGILVRLWRWLFGSIALPPRTLQRCSSPVADGALRCSGIEDPRCQGLNCSMHCREFCGDACLGPRGPAAPSSTARTRTVGPCGKPCHDERCPGRGQGRHVCHNLDCGKAS